MKLDEKIKERLTRVVLLGKQVLETERDGHATRVVDTQLAAQWVASALNLLDNVFGKESSYYQNFAGHTQGYIGPNTVQQGHGVVLAAQADYLADGIFQVRHLVEAEVFDDFLEQSEHLLASGYFAPAAVVAGCVLEDAMRKLCDKNGITLSASPKVDTMNAELAKKGVYGVHVQKRITAESDLRNKAAHGRWTEFKQEDVESMIQWVRRFLSDYCS